VRIKAANMYTPVTRLDGTVCKSDKEVLEQWLEQNERALNHSPATTCPDLGTTVTSSEQPITVSTDDPSLDEVIGAIKKL